MKTHRDPFSERRSSADGHFHIWQDNAAWLALINRAKNKDFDQGRAVALDQTAVERSRQPGAMSFLRRRYHHGGTARHGQHQM